MIENSNDFYVSFDELLIDAEQERRTFTPDKMLTYGIPLLDKISLGIFPHDLSVIGADTWVGKSELAYNIAVENAKRGKKVLLFALEWNINEIARRYTQRTLSENGLPVTTPQYRIHTSQQVAENVDAVIDITHDQWRWDNLKIFNKKTPANIAFIDEMIRTTTEYFDLFIIDHLHYIEYADNRTENQEIAQVMRTLQKTTGEVKKPIVLVWHLRKRNGNEDPTKYDLHWSSNIPKEATSVILLTKMDKYNNMTFNSANPQDPSRFAWTKIILDKSRAWMPTPRKISEIYDLKEKRYRPERSELIETSWWSFSFW